MQKSHSPNRELDQPAIEHLQEALLARRMELVRHRSGAETDLDSIAAEREIEWEEHAQEEQSADVLTRLSAQQYAELRQVDGALERIDRGEYGLCMDCGQPIPLGRLQAEPWTPRCTGCTAETEQSGARARGAESRLRGPSDATEDPYRDETPDEVTDGGAPSAPLTPELDALDDAEVAASIREAFETEVGDALAAVRVLCRDGVVILAGEVPNETLPEIARRIVEDEVGYQVVDRLLVTEVAGQPRQGAPRVRPHQLPATGGNIDEDNETETSEDVLEAEEEGITFVPPSRPVPER